MAEFVGQKHIIEYLENAKQRKRLPRFLILFGGETSGKYALAKHIAKEIIGSQPTEVESGVEAVRSVIESAYKATSKTCYIFRDAHLLSAAAQNALLKVTEEPPRKAYFIITVAEKVMPTLHSRAMVMQLQPYSLQELQQFTKDEYVLRIAATPGQCLDLEGVGKYLFEFCEKIFDNISTVTGVNALRIPGNLKLKEDQEGYDPFYFFLAMASVCMKRATEMMEQHLQVPNYLQMYAEMAYECAKYSTRIKRKGINKASLLDMWVLDFRDVARRWVED